MITWSDLGPLMPQIILALGATAILLWGAYRGADDESRSRRFLGAGALIAVLAGLWALFQDSAGHPVASNLMVVDDYGRFITALFSFAVAVVLLFSRRYERVSETFSDEYPSLLLFSAFGMSILGGAASMVTLFLGLECLSLALYVLIGLDRRNDTSLEASIKYLILGAVASAFFAFGLALLYSASGTMSIAALSAPADAAAGAGTTGLWTSGLALVLVGVGFKMSLVPFHLWSPDVYEGAPAPVVAILSTGSKGAVAAALLRLLGPIGISSEIQALLWVLAAVTMVVGNITALLQENVKRLLAFSSVAHMGYVMVAVLAGGTLGWSAVLFYFLAYTAMNVAAFGVISVLAGTTHEPQGLSAFQGLWYTHPFLAIVLSISLWSLAGIPITAGFVGKFAIFTSAIHSGFFFLAILGVLMSAISVYYYLRVIVRLFQRAPTDKPAVSAAFGLGSSRLALGLCLAATLWFGFFPGAILGWLQRAVVLAF